MQQLKGQSFLFRTNFPSLLNKKFSRIWTVLCWKFPQVPTRHKTIFMEIFHLNFPPWKETRINLKLDIQPEWAIKKKKEKFKELPVAATASNCKYWNCKVLVKLNHFGWNQNFFFLYSRTQKSSKFVTSRAANSNHIKY